MAQINWTNRANEDILNIADFLSKQSTNFAKIQIQRIIAKVDLLQKFPSKI